MIARWIAVLAAVLIGASGTARAEQNTPGDFDFYVLSLSWSPSYCAGEGAKKPGLQCSGTRPYAFVVHGLWPQYERGYPQYCDRSAPRVPQTEIDAMLPVMPSGGLVVHEWRKHGTCTGLSSADYFRTTRAARERIRIPAEFQSSEAWRTVAPGEVERAFIAANDGLKPDMIAVTCGRNRLDEVRICVDRDLGFRSCPEVDARACTARAVAMPPSRTAKQ